ncbi:DUF1924 domain-containing protein [Nitratifractor sp.]
MHNPKTMLALLALSGMLYSASPGPELEKYLQSLSIQAKKENPDFQGFDAKRGERIFTSKHLGKRGKRIACTDCHGRDLKQNGENLFTGKRIEPLSPAANPKRLSDLKKVKKWLRRNFKDVYRREGTAQEKGDVLLYILEN